MFKILVLIFSFGLSALLTIFLNLGEAWKIVISVIGFGLAFQVVFAIIFFGFVELFAIRVKKNEIPSHYNKTYRKIYNIYQSLLLSLFSVKLTVNGLSKIPNDSNFILMQNHLSNVDPIFTDYILRKYPMIFVSKESLFKIPWFGKLIRRIGYVRLTRKGGMSDANEVIRGLRWVKAEECSLCVYPEGTRNKTYPDPILLDLKESAMDFAVKTNKPIVVSVIHGSDKINDKLLFKIHKIQIDFIEVIRPEDYANLTNEQIANKVKDIMIENINHPLDKKEKVRLY